MCSVAYRQRRQYVSSIVSVYVLKDDAMPQTVLLIEDNSPSAALVQHALLNSHEGCFIVERVRKCSEAQARLGTDRGQTVAAVVTNLFLPDSQGLQTLARIFEVSPHIPILVLTNADNEHIAKQAVQRGAQDYVLQHRLDNYLLPKMLQNMLYRAANAESEFAERGRVPAVSGTMSQTMHDRLTGLLNPALFNDRLAQAIAAARRLHGSLAVLCVDIDRFKHVNDALGNDIGDHLLRSIAARLTASVRASDTVCRRRGDEFAVLLPGLAHAEDAALIAQKILASVGATHCIERHDLQITATVGIGVYPDDGTDAAALVINARNAMLNSKEQSHNSYGFFKPHMNELSIERRFIESGLRHALGRQEFVLHYQPQIDLRTGAIVGAEALIRWCRPQRAMALPAEFMSVAEQSGYIVPIGLWAMREACRQARRWRDADLAPIPVAIKISATELRSKDFVENVHAILQESGVPPQCLELEIAEHALVKDCRSIAAVHHLLRDMGVQLALDRFGTGSSSLTHLQRFPVDALKIDESLVHALCTRDSDGGIVNAVISAGNSFHVRVIAQGIETQEQFLTLLSLQCGEGQGGYFREAVPASEFSRLLEHNCCHPTMA
jgi:diguanylate cyclase (GGDEF)-like protein